MIPGGRERRESFLLSDHHRSSSPSRPRTEDTQGLENNGNMMEAEDSPGTVTAQSKESSEDDGNQSSPSKAPRFVANRTYATVDGERQEEKDAGTVEDVPFPEENGHPPIVQVEGLTMQKQPNLHTIAGGSGEAAPTPGAASPHV